MLFLKIFHLLISPTYPWAVTRTYKPQKVQSMYYSSSHSNGHQQVLQQRSARDGNHSLNEHESLGNGSNSILSTWFDSILSIFFNSSCATACTGFILVIINDIYVVFFAKKSCHNSILYKNVQKQWFLNAFNFGTITTNLRISTYMVQYWFDGMFISYTCQI